AMKGAFDQMPEAFGRIYGWLQGAGHIPRGMPVAVYFNDPAEVDPAEALWELWAPIEPDAEVYGPDAEGIAIKRVPMMRVATTMHQGPYDMVASTYERLIPWIAEMGLQVAGPPMEAYLNDPHEVAPEEILTEIMIPVLQAS
ncbi:MAG TPA: GyrI-like domain-containing protein, partial [Coriobacteriia bacterium]|nr:GyrI-like domain-containing protein [Coriobacteriia bacterium]